ncbi:MAG: glycosyltransferase [Paramuribaculum sp.]|nr:glycosyltransferase [Paramuribaculum sp.]
MTQTTDNPLVSVIMIAYNKEAYIEEAIKGVLKQATPLNHIGFSLELIIMDDCSTDDTPIIIERYRQLYPDMIKAMRNPRNLGLQGNYLAGFPLCEGRYMAICDADDYWFAASKLARQVKYMEKHQECAITFHRMVNYYEDTREMSLSNGNTPLLTDIRHLSRSNYITNSSVVYRRSLIDLTSLPVWMQDITSPDYAMHMFYATKGNIRFFRRPMGVYRKTSGSAWSMTDNYKRLHMSLDVRQRLIDWLGTDFPDASNGLSFAIDNITKAMNQVSVEPKATKRRIATQLRAALSKLIPRPRP